MPARHTISTRERILRKATEEFAKYGYSGGRMERIAKRARVDKKMLFYYFKSKEELLDAVMAASLSDSKLLVEAPDEPVASVHFWSNLYAKNRTVVRLLLWEGLEGGKLRGKAENERQRLSRSFVEKIRKHAGPGGWPDDVDPGVFLIGWLAMILSPQLFPRLTKMLTGMDSDDDALAAQHLRLLVKMAKLVSNRPREPKQPAAKP
jgi:AcrR family transcriptional regulator